MKRIIAAGLAVLLLAGLSACSGTVVETVKPADRLHITYYNDKYGDDWIKALAADFKKQNTGAEITLTGDSAINGKIGLMLLSGVEMPDIVFVSKTNWQVWADEGYMTDLGALYAGQADAGRSFSGKMYASLRTFAQYKGEYRIVPWGAGVAGLIYNAKLFEQYNWAVPDTVAKLSSLMDSIKAAKLTPFAWSGENMGYWDLAVTDWWLQSEGASGIQDYLKMESPDVYKQNGRLTALKTFQSLLSNVQNSVDNPMGIDAKKAIQQFYNGNAVMMPGGYLTLIETKVKPPADFKMGMMALPAVSGAKQTNITATMAGDFAFIPSKAANPELAQAFLAYMASDQALSTFTQKTGSPSAFECSTSGTSSLDSLAASEAKLWKKTEKLVFHSDNPIYYNALLDWPAEGSPVMQIFAGTETAQQAFETNYTYVAENWPALKKNYGGG